MESKTTELPEAENRGTMLEAGGWTVREMIVKGYGIFTSEEKLFFEIDCIVWN